MKPNEIMPFAAENITPNIMPVSKADAEKLDEFTICKLQFYNPQPIVGARLTFAYVPFQYLCCLYPPELGLKRGTIFPELDRPYGADPVYTYDG